MSKVPIRKKRARQAFWRGVTPRPCPNCGGKGPHFVPPSLGDEGFYICKREGGQSSSAGS